MSTPKYKITPTDLDSRGNIEKLKRDGHNNESIHRALYDITAGATREQREKIMNKLHERA